MTALVLEGYAGLLDIHALAFGRWFGERLVVHGCAVRLGGLHCAVMVRQPGGGDDSQTAPNICVLLLGAMHPQCDEHEDDSWMQCK